MMHRAVQNYTKEEWDYLNSCIAKHCECKSRKTKQLAGVCGACRLKRDDRVLHYLLYYYRTRDHLLDEEGFNSEEWLNSAQKINISKK